MSETTYPFQLVMHTAQHLVGKYWCFFLVAYEQRKVGVGLIDESQNGIHLGRREFFLPEMQQLHNVDHIHMPFFMCSCWCCHGGYWRLWHFSLQTMWLSGWVGCSGLIFSPGGNPETPLFTTVPIAGIENTSCFMVNHPSCFG